MYVSETVRCAPRRAPRYSEQSRDLVEVPKTSMRAIWRPYVLEVVESKSASNSQ